MKDYSRGGDKKEMDASCQNWIRNSKCWALCLSETDSALLLCIRFLVFVFSLQGIFLCACVLLGFSRYIKDNLVMLSLKKNSIQIEKPSELKWRTKPLNLKWEVTKGEKKMTATLLINFSIFIQLFFNSVKCYSPCRHNYHQPESLHSTAYYLVLKMDIKTSNH